MDIGALVGGAMFQSTLPRRERLVVPQTMHHRFVVSIHAPAKGATGLLRLHEQSYHRFNPRSREGSDSVEVVEVETTPFQSTLPRRERQSIYAKGGFVNGFQSTLPRRERL